jgi:hypothetical protein
MVQGVSGLEDAWITGYDYTLSFDARYVAIGAGSPFGGVPNPLANPLVGVGSLQDFLDYARAKGSFRFIPDITTPLNYVDGCYLVEPMKDDGRGLTQRLDWTQRLKIRNPTTDLGLALRGLLFEAAGGMDITQPLAGTFVRAAPSVTYHDANGFVKTLGANVLRNGHFVGPATPGGARTGPCILLESARTNSCLQSETLDNASWTKTRLTVSANGLLSPDGVNVTADKLVEDTSASTTHTITQAITITSGETVAVSGYFRPGGRSRARLQFADSTTTNGFRVDFDLIAGTVVNAGNIGAGVLAGMDLEYLANGWVRVLAWGQVNGSVTAGQLFLLLEDNTGNPTYTGDGASALWAWGLQVERCSTNTGAAPTSYLATTTTTVTRVGDTATAFTFPLGAPIQSMTVYAKIVDLSPVTAAVTPFGIAQIGDTGFTQPRWYIVKSSNTWSSTLGNEVGQTSSGTSGALSSAYGDVVEFVAQLDASNPGSVLVKLFVSTNGAAPSQNSGSSILLPASWHAALVAVGPFMNSGAFGLVRYKIAAGVKDFATMQAA